MRDSVCVTCLPAAVSGREAGAPGAFLCGQDSFLAKWFLKSLMNKVWYLKWIHPAGLHLDAKQHKLREVTGRLTENSRANFKLRHWPAHFLRYQCLPHRSTPYVF